MRQRTGDSRGEGHRLQGRGGIPQAQGVLPDGGTGQTA